MKHNKEWVEKYLGELTDEEFNSITEEQIKYLEENPVAPANISDYKDGSTIICSNGKKLIKKTYKKNINDMDIELIKEVYEEALNGTYNPEKLDRAYKSLTGNEPAVAMRMKKLAIYSFMNNIYPTLDKGTDSTELAVEPAVEESSHTEEVVLEKPTNTKKKTVTKRGRKPRKKE